MKMEHKIDRIGVLLLHKRDRNFIAQKSINIEFSFIVAIKRRKFFPLYREQKKNPATETYKKRESSRENLWTCVLWRKG
jgi:hypothetical protein